ncbi:MAG: potassium/proton antiporter [Bacteroidales bacterium]
MVLTPENIILLGSLLLFVSIIASRAGSRTGIPVLLFYLLIGMIAGVDGLGLNFSNPEMTQFIGNTSLVVILFSGGIDTRYSDIRKIIPAGAILATAGVLFTAALTGVFTWFLLKENEITANFSLLDGLLLAAVISSTDSASVFGLLRGKGIHIRHNLKSILELESGSNDPMAYLLTILLIQLSTSGGGISGWNILLELFLQLGIGVAGGYLFGNLSVKLMNRINLSNTSLYSVLLLSCAFLIFTITSAVNGNGFLAVYIAGLVVGNRKFVHRKSAVNFVEGQTWFVQIVMFLTLGLLVNPHELVDITFDGLMIGLFLIFIARPIAVFICLSYSKRISFRGKLFISWVGLRGAVPIIFATYPLTANLPEANLIFDIVFFITLLSLLLQGISLPWMAKWLKVREVPKEQASSFNMELPEDMMGAISELEINMQSLKNGNKVMDLPLPENILVVMIKRKEHYMIPKGHTILLPGDKILLISDQERDIKRTARHLGITDTDFEIKKE